MTTAAAASLKQADLADALLLVQHCWLEESLEGCPLDEGDFAMHAAGAGRPLFDTSRISLATRGGFTEANHVLLLVVKD